MTYDVGEFFKELENALKELPSTDELRKFRDVLDDPAFKQALARYAAGINDPDVLSELLARMRRLRRHIEERCEKRKLHKEMTVQMGVVGGIGLIGGSIVAAAAATIPLIALIPVFGGGWMALQGFFAASRLDEERHVYEQLAAMMKILLESVA